MSSILNTTEIIGTVEFPQGEFEVCAAADATYNQRAKTLAIRLSATLKHCACAENAAPVTADWLPKGETVTEHVAIEEASEVARDVFKRWVRKLREAAPSLRAATF